MELASRLANTTSQIGRYILEDTLGEGVSGIVYRAYDPIMDRDVAIKSAKADRLTPEQVRNVIKAFHHEAKIAGKYAHENIVAIYDVITEGSLDYIVMEYVPGRSIQDYMKATGRMDIPEALSVAYKCCVGLAYVHYHGVIHRDVKPGNIMYHPAHGIIKLMDFSIAHNIEDPPVADNGTIAYMAPEHFDPGRTISTLTDIFALGSTLYRMLTGKYPFNRRDTVNQILNVDPPSVRERRPEIPVEVVAILNRAMAKDCSERYQSAAEFAADLEVVINMYYPDMDLLRSANNYLSPANS